MLGFPPAVNQQEKVNGCYKEQQSKRLSRCLGGLNKLRRIENEETRSRYGDQIVKHSARDKKDEQGGQ
jgi:hypothetical protein